MSKFAPDGYTIEAERPDSPPGKPTETAVGNASDAPLPRSVSHRRNDMVSAYEEAKALEAQGYTVTIIQTTNQLVYRTGMYKGQFPGKYPATN